MEPAVIVGALPVCATPDRLVASDDTVKTHVAHVLAKLRVRGRVLAVILA